MTAVGVIYKSSAALLKLPASATLRKVSSWGLYTYVIILPAFCFAGFIIAYKPLIWQEWIYQAGGFRAKNVILTKSMENIAEAGVKTNQQEK